MRNTNFAPLKTELARRITTISHLLKASHPSSTEITYVDVGKEVRGLTIVLLFAAYEHVLTSACREILECVASRRVKSKNLKPGLRLMVARNSIMSIRGTSEGKIWSGKGASLVQALTEDSPTELDPNFFPADGSFMKSSQIKVLFSLFDLGEPIAVLGHKVWQQVDTIVANRNAIAHGRDTPDEIGRNYSISELETLVEDWYLGWNAFLDHLQQVTKDRSFYCLR